MAVTVTASTKTVKFDPTTVSVNEGSAASVTVKLGRNAPAGGVALAFTYSYAGTAASGDTGTTSASLTINQGSDTGTLSIPTTGDSLVEGDETFTVTVTTSTAGWEVVSGQNTATVTITDDDDNTAQIAFGTAYTATTKQTFSVRENVSGGVLTVPIIVSHLPGTATTFNVEVLTGNAAGTATEYTSAMNPGDFRIATKSVTFPNTGTNRIQRLTIAITNDARCWRTTRPSSSRSPTARAAPSARLYQLNAMARLATVTITDDEQTGGEDRVRHERGLDVPTTPPASTRT